MEKKLTKNLGSGMLPHILFVRGADCAEKWQHHRGYKVLPPSIHP